MNLAGAAVALVILVDIATGQGPPALQGYLAPINGYQPPAQLLPPSPLGYAPPSQYESLEYNKDLKTEKLREKEYEKGYEKEKVKENQGVLGTFQNTMSDAWSK